MGIFTPEDEQRILSSHETRAIEDKQLFFDYFCDLAVTEITDIIVQNKDAYLQEFVDYATHYSTRHIRSIPILSFKSVEQRSKTGTLYRKDLQRFYAEYEPHGSYYKSPSGVHVADLSAIYRHSNFRMRMNEALNSNMFHVTLTSKCEYDSKDIRVYENILWFNLSIHSKV